MEHLLKLLIVDDESRFLKAIAQRLKLRGFDVRTATSGAEAIAIAKSERFDVALLDLKMPGMDGSQVLRALKQEDPLLEAIILTGHGSLKSAVELTRLGAYSYLPKPYEMEKLIETLANAYTSRLHKKHATHPEMIVQINEQACQSDPLKRLQALCAVARTMAGG